MKQHPVPQHIASYEFRLVGDMTIRQFGLLASCCVVALIFYASPLPAYFKWPAIVFFVFLGIALAFLPIEERPLHRWLIAFFKATYSPTQFLWKKRAKKPEIFEKAPAKKATPKKPAAPPDQKQLRQYLQTLPVEKSPLEKEEESFLEKVANLFQVTKMPVQPTPPVQPFPSTPPPPPPPKEEVVIPKPKPKVVPKPTPPPPPRPVKIKPVKTVLPERPEIEPEKRKPAVEAKISPGLPFPQTPQTPNLLVGMVLDQKGKMVEGAILEIRNSKKIPVRALKTNKLGQFRIVTPLKNDTYEIETEKEGFTFDIIRVEVKGELMPPIEIRAK